MRSPSLVRTLFSLLVLLAGMWTGFCAGQEAPPEAVSSSESVTAVVPGSELESMTGPLLRMVMSLALVLALVGVFAWLAKRFRGAQMQGGLIHIVSGLSLGPKDRVVLLRVGQEEVLVGLSPSGMRALHVMDKPTSGAGFSLGMADQSGDSAPVTESVNRLESEGQG